MGIIFLGAIAVIGAAILVIILTVIGRIRGFSRRVFGTADLLDALEGAENIAEEAPRSLNGCDRLLLPQILKDFPDFDENLAKTYARDALQKRYGRNSGFTVYNVVIAKYLRSGAQKTVVFQAAVSWLEQGALKQRRFDLHYTYLLNTAEPTVAANCPNCGGALGYGVNVCPYCDSRIVNVMGNTWRFTQITES